MLAELAICNAAFAVLRETVVNGADLLSAGQHLTRFFDSKAEISKKAHASGSDSEFFWAQEKIKQQETELRELMQWHGRPGLWDDWLAFAAQAKRRRDDEAKAIALAAYNRKQNIWAWVNGFFIVASVLTGLIIIFGLIWMIYTKGQF